MFVFLLYECVYTFFTFFYSCYQSSFCNKYWSRARSMEKMNCTLVKSLPLKSTMFSIARTSLNSPPSSSQISNFVLKLLRWRHRYQSSHVNSPSSWFWNFVLNAGSMTSHPLLSAYSLYESLEGMFSARLVSKNYSPNSVLSKDLPVCVIGLRSRMYWHGIAAAAAAASAFPGGRNLPASQRHRFSEARWKVWPSCQRCSNLVNLTRDIPR